MSHIPQDRNTPCAPGDDPLLRLVGSGRHLWADEHADEYVKRLREDVEDRAPQ